MTRVPVKEVGNDSRTGDASHGRRDARPDGDPSQGPMRAPCPRRGAAVRRKRTPTRPVREVAYGRVAVRRVVYGEYAVGCGCDKTFRSAPRG